MFYVNFQKREQWIFEKIEGGDVLKTIKQFVYQ